MRRACLLMLVWVAVCARVAAAQVPPVPPLAAAPQSDCTSQKSFTGVVDQQGSHTKLLGQVEVECSGGMKFYADDYIEIFSEEKKIIAVGNVVFTQADTRISGERAEFNYQTRTGVFYNASGMASLGPKADRSMFGTLEPDVYFYGEKLEKVGPDKYRVTKGAFTTCVQPEPRWQLTSGTADIRLEHYAVLKNSLLKVKGVPVLYLPIMYYPVKKSDRATGFLIPTYGSSTARGQQISNAFFWAIGRSHDATILHDWYSRTGQGFGGEYRYIQSSRSSGNFRTYVLKEHESTYTIPGTTRVVTNPARQSYTLTGSASQGFGKYLRTSERIDYFSSVSVQQTYYQDILQSSQTSRTWGMSASSNFSGYSVAAVVDRAEYFIDGENRTALTGSAPRVNFQRAERPIANGKLYTGVTGEYNRLIWQKFSGSTVDDRGSTRLNLVPTLRVPFTKWPFLTVNSSAAWHYTRWSESLRSGVQIEEPVSRTYLELQSQVTGPVLTRIWNTPNNGYGEKFKHTIEPVFNVQRVSAIDNFSSIPQIDALDTVVGGSTRFAYGLNNRFYAKRRQGPDAQRNREFASVAINQSYYTNALSSQFDYSYRSTGYGAPTNFSPISITGKFSPSESIGATVQTEYDRKTGTFRSFNASGNYMAAEWLTTGASWSRGVATGAVVDQFVNSTTTVRFKANKYGGMFSFYYDLARQNLLQRRMLGYYNAQCCGFTLEYSMFDYTRLGSRSLVPRDQRFNFGFTLAGIGSFSNFFGALGGAQR